MLLIAVSKPSSSVKRVFRGEVTGSFFNYTNQCDCSGFVERLGDTEPCKCVYLSELCLLQSLFPKKPGTCGAAS